jgi:4-methyl-5(b-hydroxyethyl)-thiazole monophosphate biosynthesis
MMTGQRFRSRGAREFVTRGVRASALCMRGAACAGATRSLAAVGGRRGARRRGHRSSVANTARGASSPSDAGAAPPPSVLVPMAHGSEEMEVVIIADVLRRAGARVTIASVEDNGLVCSCSRGVKIVADASLADASVTSAAYDCVVLPGGMPGAKRLADDARVMAIVEAQLQSERGITAAMCASPGVILAPRGWLNGVASTAHPAFVKDLPNDASAQGRVVVDGRVITSRGPGTAIEFALALVEALFGKDKALEVAGPMVLPPREKTALVANEWTLES